MQKFNLAPSRVREMILLAREKVCCVYLEQRQGHYYPPVFPRRPAVFYCSTLPYQLENASVLSASLR